MARQRMPQPETSPLPPGDEEQLESSELKPEDMPEGWQLAYKRAALKGCSPKAARLYADAHGESFEPTAPTPEPTAKEIDAQIASLQEKRESLASNGS